MKTTPLLISLLLAASLSACGKKDEAVAPAPEAPAPQSMDAAPAAPAEMAMAPTPEGVAVDASAKYSASCASCHGGLGEGVGKNPKLAGLKRDEIKAKLMDYRAGKQLGPQTVIMAANAKALTDAEIDALARYLGE